MVSEESRSQIIRQLSRQLRGFELPRNCRPEADVVSTGIAPLDRLLPDAGLCRGTLTEWLGDEDGSGAGTLALLSIVQAMEKGGALIVVDGAGEFYPPAGCGLRVDLARTVLVRPGTTAETHWTLEQALQCKGVAAVLAWIEHGGDRVFRRFRLAAEAGGAIGFFIRPARVRQQPSWADVRLLVQPLPSRNRSSGRRLHVELLRCRSGLDRGSVDLEFSHETGDVHLAADLAAPAPAVRKTRA